MSHLLSRRAPLQTWTIGVGTLAGRALLAAMPIVNAAMQTQINAKK
jgi:hypothetical protein